MVSSNSCWCRGLGVDGVMVISTSKMIWNWYWLKWFIYIHGAIVCPELKKARVFFDTIMLVLPRRIFSQTQKGQTTVWPNLFFHGPNSSNLWFIPTFYTKPFIYTVHSRFKKDCCYNWFFSTYNVWFKKDFFPKFNWYLLKKLV